MKKNKKMLIGLVTAISVASTASAETLEERVTKLENKMG